jgi:hypothetical protein
MILQAQEYEASQGKVLDVFFTATAGNISTRYIPTIVLHLCYSLQLLGGMNFMEAHS